MTIIHPPKTRFDPPDGGSSPIEASITSEGHLRIQTDCDSLSLNATWMTVAQWRAFAHDVEALAEAAELIHGEGS